MNAVPTTLSGRYRLEERIAAGGMGEVWRATDQTLRRPVAVKLLKPEYASDPSFLQRFRGEARHTARLSHPGIASVYDYGELAAAGGRGTTAYLVMELVEGEPLSALLSRERRLDTERTLDILGQAADALSAAHVVGVVHRDVKPGNLLVRADGVVKVTDFGIARAVDAAPLTATGIMMGTAYYVSPEQASGRPVTPASDVYSLGIVAYECLAGRRPFEDRNPISVVMAHQQTPPPPLPAQIPAPVRSLVTQALAKDPAARPTSAGAFAHTAAQVRESLWGRGAPWGSASPPAGEGDGTTRRPAFDYSPYSPGRTGRLASAGSAGTARVPPPPSQPPPTFRPASAPPERPPLPSQPPTFRPASAPPERRQPPAEAPPGRAGARRGRSQRGRSQRATSPVSQRAEVARGTSARNGAFPPSRPVRRRRRLSLPALLMLLALTVLVAALATRSLAAQPPTPRPAPAGTVRGAPVGPATTPEVVPGKISVQPAARTPVGGDVTTQDGTGKGSDAGDWGN